MQKHWIDEFFGQVYLDAYLGLLTEERTKKEVDFIEAALELKKEDHILDLASGHGRHAIELARRGYQHVVGLDYTPVFVEKAKKGAEDTGVKVEFLLGDMRALQYENEFDAIYNYFTAMFFFNDGVNQGILSGMARALKPGGRFLLETLHREYIIRSFLPRHWWQGGEGPRVLDESRFDPLTSRLFTTRYIIYPDGHEFKKEFDLALYSLSDIHRMMTQAGLEIAKYMGDEGQELALDSHRLIVLARKPA